MRLSHYLIPTLKEMPSDAETLSHTLMLRAGLIRQLTAGVYSYLPLGWRVLRKIEQIVREEMDAIGSQEIYLPAIHPAEVWEETGRLKSMDEVLFQFRDKKNRRLVLGPTHEEIIGDLARSYIHSYRDLPQQWYQIQSKFRDEIRPRSGLIRTRQFTMKDAYSLSPDWDDLDIWYKKNRQAYINIFTRCGLTTYIVGAHSGAMGGTGSEEFMLVTDSGEDSIAICSSCGYKANLEVAKSRVVDGTPGKLPPELVKTPNQKTIEEVAGFLGVEESATMKSVIFTLPETDRPLLVLIRGDLEVSEAKLELALKGKLWRPAHPEEIIEMSGAAAGSIGPVGLKRTDVMILIDESIVNGVPYVGGANQDDYHFKNLIAGRDFDGERVDLRIARSGDGCPVCKESLRVKRAIELGHIFKLGTKYSDSMGCVYLDENNEEKKIIMGCYGLGIERVMAAAIEEHADENGIIWPMSIAPFHVIVLPLDSRNVELWSKAEEIYEKMKGAGIETLLDDRDASAGFKFKDADLFGIPIHIVLGKRTYESGNVEVKIRMTGERTNVPIGDLLEKPHDALPWLKDPALSASKGSR